MTCIVGMVAHDGVVHIAGDSAGTGHGGRTVIRRDPKVFMLGEMALGFTDSFRMGQILRYALSLPPRAEGIEDMSYLVSQFIPAVQAAMRDAGWLRQADGRYDGGTFLLGYRGHLYSVEEDFQVAEIEGAFTAIGSGEHLALGAMEALECLEPIQRMTRALEIAAKHNAYVRAPFVFVQTEGKGLSER